ncbi:flagellar biosynthesis anti-sigma factor FlgM [bacterium]|nr:flagellar biosynthesis anti-sigma factor FlgM [bacterium]
MQIRPTSNIQTTSAINLQTQNTSAGAQSSGTIPVDQLEISAEAQMIGQSNADVRADRIAEIKAQIVSGQYETSAKMDVAMSRLFDAIG